MTDSDSIPITEDMWELAAALDLTVVESRDAHQSGYWPDEQTIRIRPGLSARVARSVLAHEIGHHCLGHRPTRRPAARARQERSANEWAASRLIPPAAYAEAELVREGHIGGIAFDLNVSDELVVVYRSRLLRTDSNTYVDPRLGVGQWGHRIECSDA